MTWINKPLTEVVPPANSKPHPTIKGEILVPDSRHQSITSYYKGDQPMKDWIGVYPMGKFFIDGIIRGHVQFVQSSSSPKQDKTEIWNACISRGIFTDIEEVKVYGAYVGMKVTPISYRNPVQYHIQRLRQITVFAEE